MSFDFNQPEPAFNHDPELYAARFFGMMRSGFDDPYKGEDCEIQGSHCTMQPDEVCSDCYKTCCRGCAYQTGIADSYRCAECEQKSLERLERACKNIGSLPYQNRLAEALMAEMCEEVEL